MLSLTSAGRPVYLAPGASTQLERNSPLFDEAVLRGSFTYSLAMPAEPNGPLYGFPERPDAATGPGAEWPGELEDDGHVVMRGTQRLRSASATSYGVALADGLSAVAGALSERPLASFALGGLRQLPRYVKSAPRQGMVFNLPGLVMHANAVMADPAAYDYVFAPVRNDGFRGAVADTQGVAPSFVVNFFSPRQALVDLPAVGTFAFSEAFAGLYDQYGNYIFPFETAGQVYLPCCPWSRLRFLLRSILTEAGLEIDDVRFFPGEWADVVVVSNAELFDRGDAEHVAFTLADVVPDLTVGQLLAKLRTSGLVLLLDEQTRLVRTALLAELVADPAVQDLTEFLVGTPERVLQDVAGVTLTAHGDDGDALTQGLATAQPTAAQQGEEVEHVADLPTTWPLTATQLRPRLVRSLNAFYQSTVETTPANPATGAAPVIAVTWAYRCPELRAIDVNGGGALLEQGHCYLPVLDTPCESPIFPPPPYQPPLPTQALPAMSQPGFSAGRPEGAARSAELRLLFYQGLAPVVETPAGTRQYPALGMTSASGQLSLLLDGPQGTYETMLRTWLPVRLSRNVFKQQLRLSPLALSRLDLSRKVQLDGLHYLVRKLTGTLPLDKPVTVELVRL